MTFFAKNRKLCYHKLNGSGYLWRLEKNQKKLKMFCAKLRNAYKAVIISSLPTHSLDRMNV